MIIEVRDFLLLDFVYFMGKVRNVYKITWKHKIAELPKVILKNHAENWAYFNVTLDLHDAHLSRSFRQRSWARCATGSPVPSSLVVQAWWE